MKKLVFVLSACLLIPFAAPAHAGLAYDLGFASNYIVEAGSTVDVMGVFKNTGTEAFSFSSKAHDWIISGAEIAFPFSDPLGLNLSPAFGSGSEFANVTVLPNQSVDFLFATFKIGLAPIGSSESVRIDENFQTNDFPTVPNFYAGTSGLFLGVDVGPEINFTVGTQNSNSGPDFAPGCVYDQRDFFNKKLLSGPSACLPVESLPEPSSLASFGGALLSLAYLLLCAQLFAEKRIR
jgi:hypothetical protein